MSKADSPRSPARAALQLKLWARSTSPARRRDAELTSPRGASSQREEDIAPLLDDSGKLPAGRSEREEDRASDDSGKLSFMEVVSTLANTLIGAGVLGVPYLFPRAGIVVSLAILVAVVMTMSLTAALLVKAIDFAGPQEAPVDYGALGELAFGKRGGSAIQLVLALELWLALVNFAVLIAANVAVVAPLTEDAAILCSGAASFLLFFAPPRVIAWLSVASVAAMVGVVGVLCQAGASLPATALAAGDAGLLVGRPTGAVQALGVFLFCFAGHPCLPAIYATAREPARFLPAVRVAFALGGTYYALCGVLGYVFYGSAVRPSFTASLGLDLEGHAMPDGPRSLASLCAVGFALKLQSAAPLLATPILMVFGHETSGARGGLVLVTSAAAMMLRAHLHVAMAVTGLLAISITSVIFPVAAYLELAKPGPFVRGALLLLAALSALAASLGTVCMILEELDDPSLVTV